MKKEERRTVASAIVRKSRRLSLEELAARGKRHVRVLTAGEAFDEIESVVNETSTKRANEIAEKDRAWVFEEAREQFERAAQLRSDSERLVREQSLSVRQDADRVAALEKKLREELQELKSSLKALEARSASADPAQVDTLLKELVRREEVNRSELEARLETTMSATIDAVRKTVVAALKGTGDTSVDATSLIVSKVLDDHGGALESNVGGIRVTETRVAETGGGVRANLARLKQLRGGSATGGSAAVDAARTSESARVGTTAAMGPTAASGETPETTGAENPGAAPESSGASGDEKTPAPKKAARSKKAARTKKAAVQKPRGRARTSKNTRKK